MVTSLTRASLTSRSLAGYDGEPEDILYDALVAKIGAGELTPGHLYCITDYATTHYIVDGDETQYLVGDGIITGPTEPLIVLAVAADEISRQVWSELYPQDVIWYDWNPANWLGDYSFADQGGSTIIPNFKGVITYRRDTQYDNYAPGDWRHCMTRRWQTNADAWAVGTNYSAGDIVFHDNGGDFVYKALVDNIGQEPVGSDDGYWIIMLDLGTYTYWNASPASWQGVTSAATYDDFTLFATGQPIAVHIEQVAASANTGITLLPLSVFWDGDSTYQDSIEAGFRVNTIGAYFGGNTIGAGFSVNTIGAYFTNNTIGASFTNNTIGAGFTNNTIGAGFGGNTIGADFGGNTIGASFGGNTIGAYFYGNTIGASFGGNTIGAGFAGNTIGAGFESNTIGAGFAGNTIGAGFESNTIGADFIYNTIGANFGGNTIGANFNNNAIGTDFANNATGANFNNNAVGASFANNAIGASFGYNTIGEGFQGNTVGDDFQMNQVADYAVSAVDFTLATHVYAAYTCYLYTDSALGLRLRYVANDVDTFVAATA